ncbi:MAG: NYN domain-containing protein [Candidatus Moraniibacteriota bacterium]
MYEGKRTGVFLDAFNIAYAARDCREGCGMGRCVDYESLLRSIAVDHDIVTAIAYSGKSTSCIGLNVNLIEAGFRVNKKEERVLPGIGTKCNWDVGIALDAIKMAPKLDVVVLISGDGDFIDLVKHLQSGYSCRVEVIAFDGATNYGLKKRADVFTDLACGSHLLSPKQ